MSDDTSKVFENICTVAGAMLLAYPLIKSLSEAMEPEMKKLAADRPESKIPLLPEGKQEDKEAEEKDKNYKDEIEKLKQKLAEFEEKARSGNE